MQDDCLAAILRQLEFSVSSADETVKSLGFSPCKVVNAIAVKAKKVSVKVLMERSFLKALCINESTTRAFDVVR
jgi:hypothetical protein